MAEIRDAATVVLLRDGASGIEAWLLTRLAALAFAGGMAVFPGGRVDPDDAALPFPPGAAAPFAARLGCDEAAARMLVGAAVREVFEETEVLLTTPVADLAEARADVEAGRLRFGDLLRAHDLTVDPSGLRPWARWITPAMETRRYDARFFVAALPDGAEPRDVTSESSSAGWFPVGAALEQAQRGELGMLPPTIATLASLSAFGSVADALAAAEGRTLEPVQPTVVRGPGGYRAELPDGTSFPVPASMFR